MSRRWRLLMILLAFSLTPLIVLTPFIRHEQWLATGIASFAVIVVVILTALWLSRSMTKPLLAMVNAVQQLGKGDFSVRMDIATGDERDLLAEAFNEMVPHLEDRIRMRKALQLAKEVQQSLIPKEVPQLPGFDIDAKTIYCDETGGDYFDFFPCGEDCEGLGVVVGDVTGHDMAAALLMTTARALLRMRAVQPGAISEVVTSVNCQLTMDTSETGNYMTLFYLAIDKAKRSLHWVRAGHDPAILYDPFRDQFEDLLGSGIALGVDKDWIYEGYEKTGLASGQVIFLGTDGIWEARNAKGEMFGKDAIRKIIRQNASASANQIQEAVVNSLVDFQENVGLEDDVTMVVIKVEENL